VKRKLQVIKKNYKYLCWDFRKECRWKFDQRAATLFYWRYDRWSLKEFLVA